MFCNRRSSGALFGGLFLFLVAALCGAQEPSEAVTYCLDCHEDDSMVLEFDDGTEMNLFVDYEGYAKSVHAEHLLCTDCHELYDEDHPSGATFASRREYTVISYELCKKCHFDTYSRTLDNVHHFPLEEGNPEVPVCTNCHGAHDVHRPDDKRTMVSETCATCHEEVYAIYSKSVHGRALEADIQDVPTCTDCHSSHSMANPHSPQFHMQSPSTCIGCHGDEEKMAPYDIPTDVATSYLSDFHGVTVSLFDSEDLEERQLVVTCVDCHGVHDIESPDIVGTEGMTKRVEKACESCHEGAAADFSAAWLSHFRPSPKHAPLVWLIELFYRFFIPFMVLGLAAHILLHLYRVARRG